ncbi:MAG TPA: ABC transporter permease [Virgibacillus sp.]|nr:ABC transporter permease [Virgibacillus sp.]
MNIVNKLTLREMKKNKRRTLVTIIGVIISVAMVSAVAILATSFIDVLQRDRIATEGDWHVEYKDLNEEQIQALQTDSQTKKSYVSRDVGYANFPKSENEDKPYLFVKQFDERGFQEYPIHLTEGRLPEHPGEIVISEHISSNGGVDYQVDDELTLTLGQRISPDEIFEGVRIDQSFSLMRDDAYEIEEEITEEQTETYKIVGVIERPLWEPMWAPGYTVISYLDPVTVSSDHKANIFVTYKKVTKDIYQYTEDLAKELNIENYEMHGSLLETYGVFSNMGMASAMFTFIAIIH